ncbi:MAG: hypothetical protein M1482_13690 [Chloroflexi bacterium]|nr:hypothetical protein [Chloroflexota bacterium]
MKVRGDKLCALLMRQRESVAIVSADGRRRDNISARYAASEIDGAAFTGYGKDGVVLKVVADDAPRRGPFVTRRGLRGAMADFPRLPHVEKNTQSPGAKEWVQQPVYAGTGRSAGLRTVFVRH